MGLFSQDCHRCGHPILMPGSTDGKGSVNWWMTRGVSISPHGDIHIGTYDGYGRLGGAEDAVGFDNTVYHHACWVVLGKPMEFKGPSRWSRDQGYFFEDGAHSIPEPRLEVSP